MEIIKKIVLIISGISVVLVIGIIIFMAVGKSGVTGNYTLVSGEEGWFTEFTFSAGPPSTRGVYFSEVSGNTKKVLMGSIKIKKNIMRIDVQNFDNVEPFEMIYEKDDEQLFVTYPWENKEYTCSYEQDNE